MTVPQAGSGPSSANVTSVRDDWLTVDQLGHRVGMSARNIRAYQARRLLAPPTRVGRNAYYDEKHVHRLEEIQVLQRKGYNLAAIANIMGVRERHSDGDQLAVQVQQSLTTHPLLTHTLSRYGVVSRGNDGRMRMLRPIVLHAALDLRQAGIQPDPSLRLLSETLDRLMPVADDLIRVVGRRALLAMPGHRKTDALDKVAALAERLVVLLTEAFRVAIENQGHFWDAELAATPTEGVRHSRDGRLADFGLSMSHSYVTLRIPLPGTAGVRLAAACRCARPAAVPRSTRLCRRWQTGGAVVPDGAAAARLDVAVPSGGRFAACSLTQVRHLHAHRNQCLEQARTQRR